LYKGPSLRKGTANCFCKKGGGRKAIDVVFKVMPTKSKSFKGIPWSSTEFWIGNAGGFARNLISEKLSQNRKPVDWPKYVSNAY